MGSPHIPNSDDISKCMAVATKPEAAEYCYARVTEVFKAAKKLDKSIVSSVMETVSDYVDYVILAHSGGNEWAGKSPPSAFQNYQEGLATIAAKIIHDKKVELDYAISDDSQFLRGYTSDGNALDDESASAMDKSFNAWLASNELYSKGGFIYKSPADGQMDMEEDDPVKVNADEFRELIQDPNKGFEQYMRKTNKSVQMTMYRQEHQSSEKPSVSTENAAASRSQGS